MDRKLGKRQSQPIDLSGISQEIKDKVDGVTLTLLDLILSVLTALFVVFLIGYLILLVIR